MPLYEMRNKETGEIVELTMKLAEYEQYKLQNPQMERYFSKSIPMGDPLWLDGVMKVPRDFQHGVIERIRHSVPGNTLSDRKYNVSREVI